MTMRAAPGMGCVDVGTVIHPASMRLQPACSVSSAVCDDSNPCTTDTCDAMATCPPGAPCSGCTRTPRTGMACDDGNACTTGDMCSMGPSGPVCTPGAPMMCMDDGDSCTDEVCDALTGTCGSRGLCRTDPLAVCTPGTPAVCSCAPGTTPGPTGACMVASSVTSACAGGAMRGCAGFDVRVCEVVLGGVRGEGCGVCTATFDGIMSCLAANPMSAWECSPGIGFGAQPILDMGPCQAAIDAHNVCLDPFEETCDGTDQDCDGSIDEGLAGFVFYRDGDADGWGDDAMTMEGCGAVPAGYADRGGDCDDSARSIHPSAPEECDMLDNDCNMLVDDGLPENTFYFDGDMDGWGDTLSPIMSCEPSPSPPFVVLDGDCDDMDPGIFPGMGCP